MHGLASLASALLHTHTFASDDHQCYSSCWITVAHRIKFSYVMDGFEEGEEAIFKVDMDIHHRGPG